MSDTADLFCCVLALAADLVAPTSSAGQLAASDWAARVVTNGGAAPSAGTKTALAGFYDAIDTAGILSKMLAVNCVVPDNLIAATTPLIKVLGSDPWANHNFLVGDLTMNGLVGNGSTKYMDTGVIPGAAGGMTNLTDGLTVYIFTGNNNNEVEFSSYNGAVTQTQLYVYGGTAYFQANDGTAGAGTIAAVESNFTGYLSGNRIAQNDNKLYAASSSLVHGAIASGAGLNSGGPSPTINLFVWCANSGGAPATYSSKRISFVAAHKGLTTTESLAFFNAIQAMRTALGGGYV